jgi:2-dehydro-3-deoxyglucarate aldolase
VPPDTQLLKEKIEEGYTFLAYSLDSLLLADTCRKDLKKVFGKAYRPRSFLKETN